MKKKLVSLLLGVIASCFILTNANAAGIPAGFVVPTSQSGQYVIVFMNFNSQYTQSEVEGYVKGLKKIVPSLIKSLDPNNTYAQNTVMFGPSDLLQFGDADAIHAALAAQANSANPTFMYLYVNASKVQFNGKTNLRFDTYIYNKNVPNGQYLASLEVLSDLVSILQ